MAWIAASTVPLASVVKGSIKHHTLACSTFTQAMRCIRYKVASADKKLGNGRHYDVETIRATDAAMADAFDKGIKWLVLKLPLQFLYPGLFGRLSQARNVAGHIQRSAHEVQGISSMWSMWSQQLAEPEGELDLAVIKRAINQQKPWFSAYLDAFYAFLYSKSGGPTDGLWWKEFVKFHHAFVTPSLRSMSGDMFEALADFAWMLLAYAILKTAYLCPKGFARG